MVKRAVILFICMASVVFIFPAAVSADTDGQEIRITDMPDRLVLQLGPQWAGVEFELKTDAGIFPAPVLVDPSGVLTMDLGGSKTYTLSCITSPVTVPEPEASAEAPPTQPQEDISSDSPEDEPDGSEPAEPQDVVPASHLILFLAGLAAAAGGLIVLWYFKRKREAYYEDYDDEDGGE